MARSARLKYTKEIKSEIWDRYQQGESLNSIGRIFATHSTSIDGQLVPTGGIRPPERRRSTLSLTMAEREEISRGIAANLSVRSIAFQLGRSPSTVSREINRNGDYDDYRDRI